MQIDPAAIRSWAGVQAPPAAAPAAAPGAAGAHPGAAPAAGAQPDPGTANPKGLAAAAKTALAAFQQAMQELDEVAAAAEMTEDADPEITAMLGQCSEACQELVQMVGGIATRLEEDGSEDDEADQEDELDDEDDDMEDL